MLRSLRRLLIGRPLHNQEEAGERLPKWKALPIFSSDALSSVGYGPEQIALTLAVPGLLMYGYFSYAAIAVIALLLLVTISYAQVARANPGGGGSYSIAMHYLGETPALVAGAALFADYTLTVAVSISSGTEAIVSAFPALLGYEVTIDLLVLFGILMLINLRGVRESSNVFVAPTYLFIFGMLALIGSGLYQALTQGGPLIPSESMVKQQFDWMVLVLILRAFSNGCSSMTGVEAISNGVPMFKKPEVENAIKTTYWMSGMLAVMLAGISFLILHYHIVPAANVTVLSQVVESAVGRGWLYFYIQITTMLVLYLAANTSYNGLPPLLSIMARDGYMPRYLGARGERLSFSNGIFLLSIIAGILIAGFKGNVEQLISLYAIGVFLSFTIAQTSLVVKWNRERPEKWVSHAIINGVGAVITGLVVIIIAVTKFFYGAWIVLVFIPAMIVVFRAIRRHYRDMAEQLHLPLDEQPADHKPIKNIVVVPVASPTRVVMETMKYARTIGTEIIALHISTDAETGRKVAQKWADWNPHVRLVTVNSPYRLVIQPLIDYIDELQANKDPEDFITVLIPEFETRKGWHRLLHNQTGWILRTLLIFRENVVVATIPFHLKK
ncbi:amino acid transporter [Anaerosporomusa subterranea]|uniref:Amino acid transporter n=1 Tax=Anaerosporomusa subterranea TaxID=1794912 RepID=A0A154BP39_ANASB|nr:APC family permease [Anaerosporomusa subterranea]KYZ75702.1 amino acid transporter [Anaerosporomusa subterranea]